VADEKCLVYESLSAVRAARAAAGLPAVPTVVFSATTGRAPDERQAWTRRHARLAASVPNGEHVVLAGTTHAVNQERPAEIAQAINRIIGTAGHR
jgi:alpha-beta hydrolase superfamily lysophospholipase